MNRPLSWEEIISLEDGKKVWSEYYGLGHGGGVYIKRGNRLWEDGIGGTYKTSFQKKNLQ